MMKITSKQLKQIIKEELASVLSEGQWDPIHGQQQRWQGSPGRSGASLAAEKEFLGDLRSQLRNADTNRKIKALLAAFEAIKAGRKSASFIDADLGMEQFLDMLGVEDFYNEIPYKYQDILNDALTDVKQSLEKGRKDDYWKEYDAKQAKEKEARQAEKATEKQREEVVLKTVLDATGRHMDDDMRKKLYAAAKEQGWGERESLTPREIRQLFKTAGIPVKGLGHKFKSFFGFEE